jgi:hypothetical protein
VFRLTWRLFRRRLIIRIGLVSLALWLVILIVGALSGSSVSESYVLGGNRTHEGDLTVVALKIELQDGTNVTGDVSMVAIESATVGGSIDGDLSIIASGVDVYFRPSLRVNGDLSICARSINGLIPQQVGGEIDTGCNEISEVLQRYRIGNRTQQGENLGMGDVDFSTFLPFFRGYSDLGQVIMNTLIVTVLAGVVAVAMPEQHQRLVKASIASTLPAGVLGLVTIGAVIIVSVIYAVLGAVTLGLLLCFGLPIMALVWLALNLGLILGWITVSFSAGAWLIQRWGVRYTRVRAAVLGCAALTATQGVVSLLPCLNVLGGVMLVVIGSVGLGAVMLTRAGWRAYPVMIDVKAKH